VKKKKPRLRRLLEKVSPENVHAELDWGKPRGKEGW
jgi:antitoxin component of MazEF toxin-antitoxin module